MRLAAEQGLAVDERFIEEAHAAEEAFLTSASMLVMPVVSIDGRPVADGKPGPLSRRLREALPRPRRRHRRRCLRIPPLSMAEPRRNPRPGRTVHRGG